MQDAWARYEPYWRAAGFTSMYGLEANPLLRAALRWGGPPAMLADGALEVVVVYVIANRLPAPWRLLFLRSVALDHLRGAASWLQWGGTAPRFNVTLLDIRW